MWDTEKEITFYPEQRRYLRVETDAYSQYHDLNDPKNSRINVIIVGEGVALRGTTPLQDGRMRVILEGQANVEAGTKGTIRIELSRHGLPVVHDERAFKTVEVPPARPGGRRVSFPQFEVRQVEGPDDGLWTTLGWPDNINTVASSAKWKKVN